MTAGSSRTTIDAEEDEPNVLHPQASSTLPANLQLAIVTGRTLLLPEYHNLLLAINRLINDAYIPHSWYPNDGKGRLFTNLRFMSDEELPNELEQNNGFAAVVVDKALPLAGSPSIHSISASQSYHTSIYLFTPVAIASIKPFTNTVITAWSQRLAKNGQAPPKDWKGVQPGGASDPESQNFWAMDATSEKWEVGTCASLLKDRYRKQGLIGHCINAIVERLRLDFSARRLRGETGHKDQGQPHRIRLFISSLNGSGNTEYWLRRGYVKDVGNDEEAFVGCWSSIRPFEISTLTKFVDVD